MTTAGPRRQRVVHVVYGFGVGGLENVIVQLINRLPAERFEHVVLSLTTISDFRQRVRPSGVRFIELNKPPGHAIALYPRIYRLLRELKPQVVHSCNLAALEIAPLAWLARVPLRVHAEHGWDAHDPKGENPRYRRLRRIYQPFLSHTVAVSRDLDDYLARQVGVAPERHSFIPNGVDTSVFTPASDRTDPVEDCPFSPTQHWLIGTVGRLQTVKNQPLLARAFVRLLAEHPELAARARLVIVGEGPLRTEVAAVLDSAGLGQLAWLPGARNDVAHIMRRLGCFVLPSQAEGTSCTLQEAMASGLPIVATAVGGTPELIEDGRTGLLVPADDEASMARALWRCCAEPAWAQGLGQAARAEALAHHGIDAMVARYERLFGAEKV
jgi:sugar transferase (PEP-CTERM/EpsH1 system associated)